MITTAHAVHPNDNKRILIRTDASVLIGSGHLMRCLTLADQLCSAGAEVAFACYDDLDGSAAQIIGKRYPLIRLDDPQPGTLPGGTADLLIVDHYGIDHLWHQAMRPFVKHIMVIDDLANRPLDCNLLLNQNIHAGAVTYRRLVPDHCRTLLGPGYTLLRPEFYHLAPHTRTRSSLKRLLLCFGGSDPCHLTEVVLHELADNPLMIDVVIGAGNNRHHAIKALCDANPERWTLHIQTAAMATLMAHADLAIGAGGSSHWERCLLGLPALVVTVADNQVESTRLLHEQGACQWLGDASTLSPGAIRHAIEELAHNPQRLEQMSHMAAEVVPQDGGTRKVVEAIQSMLAADKC